MSECGPGRSWCDYLSARVPRRPAGHHLALPERLGAGTPTRRFSGSAREIAAGAAGNVRQPERAYPRGLRGQMQRHAPARRVGGGRAQGHQVRPGPQDRLRTQTRRTCGGRRAAAGERAHARVDQPGEDDPLQEESPREEQAGTGERSGVR